MKNSERQNKSRKRRHPSENRKVQNRVLIIVFRILLVSFLILCFAAAGAVTGAVFGVIENAPKLELIAIKPDVYTSIIYDSKGEEIDRLHGEENREYVSIDKIPKNLQNAIVAIEDERFYSHDGVDVKGLFRATYNTLSGKRLEGASTITQQLIKNNITKVTRNSIETKLQEQYLAIKYEQMLKKDLGSKTAAKKYILELYLNSIALHHGYNGVQVASMGYFNKDVSELDLAESAVIAAITNNPSLYSPRTKPENNKKRVKLILDKMLELEMITKSQYNEAIAEDVYSRVYETEQSINEEGTVHSYFVDSVFDAVSRDLQEKYSLSASQANNMLYNKGLQIYATIDTSMQKIVDEAFLNDELFSSKDYKVDITYKVSVEDSETKKQRHFNYQEMVASKDAADEFVTQKRAEVNASLSSAEEIVLEKIEPMVQPQAAMVIMDYYTGEVKALSGGRGEKMVNRSLNRATASARQPGSVFKVLASFAPGIDLGVLTPATVIDDVPYGSGSHQFKNWWGANYKGLSTVRKGVRESMNIVAVKAMSLTGVDKCFEYLLNFGFTTLVESELINGQIYSDINEATALGGLTYGVTQIEVTAAFGAIANEGLYNKPILYTKVLDHDGVPLLENEPNPVQILKKTSAFLLTDMMKDVVTGGTGGSARFKKSAMNIAGKTGTTTDSKDLTFVGYTPYYAAGIWMGYDRHDSKVTGMTSTNHHTLLWSNIMEQVHEGLENKEFPRPEGITTAYVCQDSGKLAVAGLCDSDPRGSQGRTEYFAAGTAPTTSCDVHVKVTYDTLSDMIAGEFCPSDAIATRIGIVRPIPYNGPASVADKQYEIPSEVLNGTVCTMHTADGVYDVPPEALPTDQYGFPIIEDFPSSEYTGSDAPTQRPGASQPMPTVPDTQQNVLPNITPVPMATAVPTPPPQQEPVMPAATPVPVPTQRTGAVFDDPITIDSFSSPQ